MKPVRINRTARSGVSSFGMILKADHPDCQVGTPFLAKNGRFIITKRTLDPKTNQLELTLTRDPSTRQQRKGQPPAKTLISNSQYDALRKPKP